MFQVLAIISSMNAVPVIKTNGLTKKYDRTSKPALENLSIEIDQGEVYGFLGPNGAGKSTTIRLLLGLLRPTSGSAAINQLDTFSQSVQIKKSLGYLSGDLAMYPKMTGSQLLRYVDSLSPGSSMKESEVLAQKLQANLDKPLGQLSRGNRQKIGIIQAFAHKPDVLILDEPTSGLDPLMQENFYELVIDAKKRGACIFMSSHILSEVQKMCDRVGIIREGRLVSQQSIADMTLEAASALEITFAQPAPVDELRKLTGARLEVRAKNEVTVHIKGNLSPLFAILATHEVTKIDTRSLDLEELFMHFYADGGSQK